MIVLHDIQKRFTVVLYNNHFSLWNAFSNEQSDFSSLLTQVIDPQT